MKVDYCGSWGYGSIFKTVKENVSKFYPKAIIEGNKIPGNTGCFDIFVNNIEIYNKVNYSYFNKILEKNWWFIYYLKINAIFV